MDYHATLKNNGLKSTRPRIAILRILQRTKKPLSATVIFEKLRHEVDLVTVYRILQILTDKGIIFSELMNGEERYFRADSPHHHVVCEKCETTECIPCTHPAFNLSNFTGVKHDFSLRGLCNKCA